MKEFFNFSINKNINALRGLQKNIESNLKTLDKSFCFKPINNNAFNFPYFNEKGIFADIHFD